jgi:hypothetical protein
MPWEPEDRNAWLTATTSLLGGEPDHLQAARLLLGNLPDRGQRVVADASGVLAARWPHLAESFARVVAFPPERCAAPTRPPCGRRTRGFDVVLLVDLEPCPARERLRALFAQAREQLSEGGWLLATLPAVPASRAPRVPFAMPLGPDPPAERGGSRFHPVEAQYLLARAGYPGVRIRRFARGSDGDATLFCVATRRASN